MKLLKVVSIEEAQDRTGLTYKKVGFEPFNENGNKEILTNDAVRYRNLWPERRLEDGNVIKADPLFAKVKIGSLVAGHIETLPTTPYTVGENQVSTYTGVFFSNENVVTVANRNLSNYDANVVDITTGEVLGAVRNQEGATPTLSTSSMHSAAGEKK